MPTMPTSARKGWRDKWHDKRPRTPLTLAPSDAIKTTATSQVPASGLRVAGLSGVVQPAADLPAPKSSSECTVMTDQTRNAVAALFERYRPLEPESTGNSSPPTKAPSTSYHLSRASLTGEPSVFDTLNTDLDMRTENGDDGSTLWSGKPRLTRYISDYLAFGTSSEPVFPAPWSENKLPMIEIPIDPLVAIQMIRSHIQAIPSRPLPVEHASGLLRIFEDYRKVKEDKDKLEAVLRHNLSSYLATEEAWAATECRYQSEIRRLELLIANGTSGMEALVEARRGTIVKRKRIHRNAFSTSHTQTVSDPSTGSELDREIQMRVQKAQLQTKLSPSRKMSALSKHFSGEGAADTLIIGNPPGDKEETTLMRKANSELDLLNMRTQAPSNLMSLSTRAEPTADALSELKMDEAIESDAFIALRELALLVARRKGLDPSLVSLMVSQLFVRSETNGTNVRPAAMLQMHKSNSSMGSLNKSQDLASVSPSPSSRVPELSLQNSPEQSHPEIVNMRRRHFSFEPGEEQLAAVNEGLRRLEMTRQFERFKQDRPRSRAGSQSTRSSHSTISDEHKIGNSWSEAQTLSTEAHRPSKIPSPVHGHPLMAAPRRADSTSSTKTVSGRDEHRISRASVLTAFRQNSSDNYKSPRDSRGSSRNNLVSGEQPHSLHSQNSVAALAAVRAVDSVRRATPEAREPVSAMRREVSGAMASSTASRKGDLENRAPQMQF